MRPRLLFLLFLAAATPVLAHGIIAPRFGPAAYNTSGRVASNGTDYLVAWTTNMFGAGRAYTNRVAADGSPIGPAISVDADAQGNLIYPPQHGVTSISVTPGRDGYFLAWLSPEGLTAAITDAYGRVEHRSTIASFPNAFRTMSAWNGAAHLVLTTSLYNGAFGASLFDNNGDPIAANVPLGDAHAQSEVYGLTADSSGFLVLSTKIETGHVDLYGRRVTASGVPGEWFLIRSIAPGVGSLDVASDGSKDVIVWSNAYGLWSISIDSQTNAILSDRQLLPAAGPAAIAIASGRTWIEYQVGTTTSVFTIDSNGSQTPPVIVDSSANGIAEIDLASNGSGALLIGTQFQNGLSGVHGSLVTPTSAGPLFDVAITETDQEDGDLTAGPNQLLAVWDEKLTADRQIFAARLDGSGNPLDRDGIEISSSGNDFNPAVAFNGSNYLIVWTRQVTYNTSKVVGRRLSPAGTLIDTADIEIGDGSSPHVASDGTNWLVVYTANTPRTGCGASPTSTHILATRVSPAGVLLDGAGIRVTDNPENEYDPDVAWTGTKYAIVSTAGCSGTHQPFVSAISATLASADLSTMQWAKVSNQGYIWIGPQRDYYGRAHVTGANGVALIAWQHFNTDASTNAQIVTVEYKVVKETVPAGSTRHRVTGSMASFPSLSGTYVGVGTEASGQNYIATIMTTPWARDYQGLFQTIINPDGSAQTPSFRFVVDPSAVALTGHIVAVGARHFMLNMPFDRAAGAVRLYVQTW